MPDPLDYEPHSSPHLTHAQLMARVMWWAIGSIVFSSLISLFTVAWSRIVTDTTAIFAMMLFVFSFMALACGKFAHLIVQIFDRRFPNLSVPFSVLPYVVAVILALGLMLVCSAMFYMTAVVVSF